MEKYRIGNLSEEDTIKARNFQHGDMFETDPPRDPNLLPCTKVRKTIRVLFCIDQVVCCFGLQDASTHTQNSIFCLSIPLTKIYLETILW